MRYDPSKTVLTFKHPRASRELQEREGRKFFAPDNPRVLHVGVNPVLPLSVVESADHGDTYWMLALSMVVVDRRKVKLSGAAQLTMFCDTAAANRVTLIEGSTGRNSKQRAQWSRAVDEAHKLVSQGGKRLPKTGARPGRKRKEWPSEQVEKAARKQWFSKHVEYDAAAIRQITEQWSELVDIRGKPLVTDRLIRSLGPSGRQK